MVQQGHALRPSIVSTFDENRKSPGLLQDFSPQIDIDNSLSKHFLYYA